jgi:hypothetical protein
MFHLKGRVHLNRRGRHFSRLLAAEVCASALVMLDTPCYAVVRRVLATHFIRQFPLHFPSRASPSAVRFQLDSTILRQVHYSSHSSSPFVEDNFTAHINLTRTVGDKNYVLFRRDSIPSRHIREHETLLYTVPRRMASRYISLVR